MLHGLLWLLGEAQVKVERRQRRREQEHGRGCLEHAGRERLDRIHKRQGNSSSSSSSMHLLQQRRLQWRQLLLLVVVIVCWSPRKVDTTVAHG